MQLFFIAKMQKFLYFFTYVLRLQSKHTFPGVRLIEHNEATGLSVDVVRIEPLLI